MAYRTDSHSSRGFTLLELLVTLATITMLVAILLPALRSVRKRSRALNCQLNLRSIAFDFQAFAQPVFSLNRGDDENDPMLRDGEFRIETFHESQYHVDEFWGWPGQRFVGRARDLGVMACPEVDGEVQLLAGKACRDGAVSPAANVAYALNLRLDRAEVEIGGFWTTQPVRLSDRILDRRLIPLAWDIQGAVAEQRRITPHYSAPPGEPNAPYGQGREWFPAISRHGSLQVVFTSGEVLTSEDPLRESAWQWSFNP